MGEDTVYGFEFVGECICEHEQDAHGWGECGVKMPDGTLCPCKAGWVE